eukprot:12880047-Prorocentrum_lima.AAC.1
MSEKGHHPELVQTRKWWMQQHLNLPDILHKKDIHQTQRRGQYVPAPTRGPIKARVAQPMENRL